MIDDVNMSQDQFEILKKALDKLTDAVCGNLDYGQEGLIHVAEKSKLEIAAIRDRVVNIEKERAIEKAQLGVWKYIMGGLAGALGSFLVQFFVTKL